MSSYTNSENNIGALKFRHNFSFFLQYSSDSSFRLFAIAFYMVIVVSFIDFFLISVFWLSLLFPIKEDSDK